MGFSTVDHLGGFKGLQIKAHDLAGAVFIGDAVVDLPLVLSDGIIQDTAGMIAQFLAFSANRIGLIKVAFPIRGPKINQRGGADRPVKG